MALTRESVQSPTEPISHKCVGDVWVGLVVPGLPWLQCLKSERRSPRRYHDQETPGRTFTKGSRHRRDRAAMPLRGGSSAGRPGPKYAGQPQPRRCIRRRSDRPPRQAPDVPRELLVDRGAGGACRARCHGEDRRRHGDDEARRVPAPFSARGTLSLGFLREGSGSRFPPEAMAGCLEET